MDHIRTTEFGRIFLSYLPHKKIQSFIFFFCACVLLLVTDTAVGEEKNSDYADFLKKKKNVYTLHSYSTYVNAYFYWPHDCQANYYACRVYYLTIDRFSLYSRVCCKKKKKTPDTFSKYIIIDSECNKSTVREMCIVARREKEAFPEIKARFEIIV